MFIRRGIAIDAEAETVREQGAQPGELRGQLHLPPNLLNLPRDREVHLPSGTLTRYSPQGERARVCRASSSTSFILFMNWNCRLK